MRGLLGSLRRRWPALAVLAGGVLLFLADRAALVGLLLAVAVIFSLLVVLVVVLVAIWSLAAAPDWMMGPDGQLVGLWQRVRLAVGHWRNRLQARPGRSPQRIYHRVLRDSARLVTHAPDGRPVAFSHLLVSLHPDTVAKVDGWLPIESLTADVAQNYADKHAQDARRSAAVVVVIDSDPTVPVGSCTVAGSFREAQPVSRQARASARLTGPAYGGRPIRSEQARVEERFAPATPGPFRESTRMMPDPARPSPTGTGSSWRDDSTQVLPNEDADQDYAGPAANRAAAVTVVLPGNDATDAATPDAPARVAAGMDPDATVASAQARPDVLVLRRCGPGGAVIPGAQEHLLDGGRVWTVGRSSSSDVVLPQEHVSRRHLEFIPGPAGWMVSDSSSLGTTLNGRPLATGKAIPVVAGDVLELGGAVQRSEDRVLLQVC